MQTFIDQACSDGFDFLYPVDETEEADTLSILAEFDILNSYIEE